jgi:hypothetical protein
VLFELRLKKMKAPDKKRNKMKAKGIQASLALLQL